MSVACGRTKKKKKVVLVSSGRIRFKPVELKLKILLGIFLIVV